MSPHNENRSKQTEKRHENGNCRNEQTSVPAKLPFCNILEGVVSNHRCRKIVDTADAVPETVKAEFYF